MNPDNAEYRLLRKLGKPEVGLGLGVNLSGWGVAAPIYAPIAKTAFAAAYAMFRVWPDYAGPLFELSKVGGATMDVYAVVGAQWPDYLIVDAWAAGEEVRVSKRYDQTGLGLHETQATWANMPAFTSVTAVRGKRPLCNDTSYNGSWAEKWLNIPDLGVDRRATGVHMLISPRCSSATRMLFEMDSTNLFSAFTISTNRRFSIANPSTSTGRRFKSQLCNIGIKSSSAERATYLDGVKASNSATTSAIILGGKEGASATAGYYGTHDSFSFLVFNRASTDAEMTLLDAWSKALLPIVTAPTRRLIYGGSSLQEGLGSTLLRTPLWCMNLDSNWDAYNFGVGGQTLTDEYTKRATYEFEQYDATKALNVLVIDAPSNDIANATYASQAAAESSTDSFYAGTVLSFISAARTQGFVVVVPTCIARGAFTTGNYREYARVRYNQLVAAGAAANNYTLSDRAADARLSNPANTTYFLSDQAHLTDAGTSVLAAIDKAAVGVAAGVPM